MTKFFNGNLLVITIEVVVNMFVINKFLLINYLDFNFILFFEYDILN